MALHFHNYPPSGFNVVVGAFDDAGWMEEKVRWGPWDEKKERIPKAEEGPSLAEAIAGGTNLPVAEASELAGSALACCSLSLR